MQPTHACEVRPRKDKRGVDLISDALPFGRLWYGEPNAVAYSIGYTRKLKAFGMAFIICLCCVNRLFSFYG